LLIICCSFSQGIADIAGQVDGSDYELVEISNPDLLFVKGSSEDVTLEACKDLTHMQQLLVYIFCSDLMVVLRAKF
jgi:hypothetical protein